MSKYVYIVWGYDSETWDDRYIHKCFDTLEAAETYVKENIGKVFPEDRGPRDQGYRIGRFVRKHKLYGEDQ